MPVSTWRSFSWAVLLFAPLLLSGQSLQISSAKASRGGRVTLQVVLTSPAGREPLGLQWETTFPVDRLVPFGPGVSLGAVTRAAGKSVQCAATPQAGESAGSKCILIGGRQPIHNGVIARLQFRVPPKAPEGSARVLVDQCSAVFKDLKQTPLPAVEAIVQIRSQ
jgi:hypothetical protein